MLYEALADARVAAAFRIPPAHIVCAPLAAPSPPPLIALTGRRHVGKSTAANLLADEFGYTAVHAFSSGKEAALRYFECITGDDYIAERMVYGDLKDVPSHLLPGEVAPRHFLELFGKFMGVDMGVEWTLGMEIRAAQKRAPGTPIVIESLIYEADWFRAQGGYIVRLERPGYANPEVPSDAAQATIEADETIVAHDLFELTLRVAELAERMAGK